MKATVKSNAELTVEERNLLSVAHENGIASRVRLGESSDPLSGRSR